MGKRLDVIYHEGTVLFLTAPAARYPEGDDSFQILYEILNPLDENEKATENIVGFEVGDIFTLNISDIPDINEKYDIAETDLKDMTIKEIVSEIQKDLLRNQRKTA